MEATLADGGPPTCAEHMNSLGFSLDKSVDPDRPLPDGGCEPLSEEKKFALMEVALLWCGGPGLEMTELQTCHVWR